MLSYVMFAGLRAGHWEQRQRRLWPALTAFPAWRVGGRWRHRLPSTSWVGLSDVTGPEELVFPAPVGGLEKVRGGVIRAFWQRDEVICRKTVLF